MSTARSKVAPLVLAVCAATLAHAPAATAQMSAAAAPAGLTPQKIAEMIPNMAGIGVGAVPDYVGSDDYTFAAAPALYYRFGNTSRNVSWAGVFGSANLIDSQTWSAGPTLQFRPGRKDVDDAVVSKMSEIDNSWEAGVFGSANLIDSQTWSAGPTLQFRPGRKDVDDAVVSKMSEIDNSWEAGVFVGYQYVNVQGVPWIARANVGVQWNLNDEYDDAYWWASGQFYFPLREDLFVALGGGLGGGSSSFNQTYFGVTPANAAASGLPVYSPGGGVSNVYAWPALLWRFHPNWLGAVGVLYSRVTGDAGDSPIVRDRGDANQWIGGVGLAYVWR
jgi:outer membrane protein